MFLPGFLLFFTFAYFPMYGLLLAFKNYQILDGIWKSPWAGFAHFHALFGGTDFFPALRNTVVIALLKLLFVFPAPIVFALLLNEVRSAIFRKLVQSVSYLPHFFSWVILAGILFRFLAQDGALNQVLGLFGKEPVNWLLAPGKFYGILVATDIWASVGWSSIIYFAALSGVDPVLYEAAVIDGAGRWKRVKHITIPSIMPTVVIMFLIYIGHFLSVGLDQIYNLETPLTEKVGDTLDIFVLRRLTTMDYSLGTAAGIFSSTIGLALVLIGNRLVKWYDRDQGLW